MNLHVSLLHFAETDICPTQSPFWSDNENVIKHGIMLNFIFDSKLLQHKSSFKRLVVYSQNLVQGTLHESSAGGRVLSIDTQSSMIG